MNNQAKIIRRFVGFLVFVTLLSTTAWAQLKAMGEIASASQTTINDSYIVSGMTVFNNNRIRTTEQGTAIINLGSLGRIEFGPKTDMTLRFSKAGIGGELHSNQVVVSARAGVPISVTTPKGMISTDGRQPAVLTIYVDSKRARVITHLGEATVTSGGKEEHMAEGEELSQSPRSTGWQHTNSPPRGNAVTRPKIAVQTTSSVTTPVTSDASIFTELFNSGISYSIAPESNGDRRYGELFETSITCRNNDQMSCRNKSEFKPRRSLP
ncbi:MAG: hypothetical protein L0220_28845 [Acidobacteria bacterium]|nr:hypothetical protein [Acidobacteriota bacterium]